MTAKAVITLGNDERPETDHLVYIDTCLGPK
jgi:hypothetical protein